MPGFQLLMHETDTIYTYDGSLAGFYCCVHAAVYGKELPLDITSADDAQCTLMPPRFIDTDSDQALRVRHSIRDKISPRMLELCENVFLSCLPQKERALLLVLLRGYRQGGSVANDLANPLVNRLLKAERHTTHEAHLLSGFIRFADHQGTLIATISPKNFVLPLLAPHFADRYSQEAFLIYDNTHNAALFYQNGHFEIAQVEQASIPPPDEKELHYQALWRRFYNTIGIKERENPRCRMTHMPKRYWVNMVEMQEAEDVPGATAHQYSRSLPQQASLF